MRSRSWGVGVGERLARQRRHVLHHRPARAEGRRDDRLSVLVEVDELGVAAILEVRHARVRPGVLVVADELAVRVRGEGGLAGAREPEEDRPVTAGADVGRAVHGHVPELGQEVVHDREHPLLVHAAIVRAAHDQHDAALEVGDDGALAEGPVDGGVSAEAGDVQERPALAVLALDALNPLGEHVVHEHRVRGVLTDEAIRHGVARVGPAIDVLHEERGTPRVQVLRDAAQQRVEVRGVELLQVVLPPDLLVEAGVGHGEGVLDRSARAARVAVEEQRAVDAQLAGVGLRLIIGAARSDPASVVLDRRVKELVLGEVGSIRAVGQTELSLEVVLEAHGFDFVTAVMG